MGLRAVPPALAAGLAVGLMGACTTERPANQSPGSLVEAFTLDDGAELLAVVVDDPSAIVEVARAGSENPGDAAGTLAMEIEPEQRRALKACGIRLVALRATALASALDTALGGMRGSSRSTQSVPSGPSWVEALHEPGADSPRVIALHDSRWRLRPGFLRLLFRCWSEPRLTSGPDAEADRARFESILRLELAFQHVEGGSSRSALGAGDAWSRTLADPPSRPRGLEERGQILSRLTTRVGLGSGQALAILYARPGSDDDSAGEPVTGESGDADTGDAVVPKLGEVRRDADSNSRRDDPSDGRLGPAGATLFRTPTLGEVLLGGQPASTTDAASDQPASRRQGAMLLIIVPRVRDHYSLFGR
ncbi:MAG: hypothetical protein AB7K52_05870 [Phycisphaerales bacterium]